MSIQLVTGDEESDGCPVCQAVDGQKEKGQSASEDELRAAMQKMKDRGAMVTDVHASRKEFKAGKAKKLTSIKIIA